MKTTLTTALTITTLLAFRPISGQEAGDGILSPTLTADTILAPVRPSDSITANAPSVDSVTSEARRNAMGALQRSGVELEIGELVFDETITKVGRDFYDIFFTQWENPTSITSFSITIKERPMPGLGTQVRVYMEDNEVFARFMQPNQEMIEILAGYAVQLCQNYLVNYQEIQAQLRSEDQLGTGIY